MKRYLLLLAGLVIVVSIALFYQGNNLPQQKHKVFLIGIDGASWNLMADPLQAGKLPNFKRLMDNGTYGSLRSFHPTSSPVLWTSVATGKKPEKHGVRNFTETKDGKTVPVSGGQRITKAYWNIFSDYGLRVGIVNWWVTWPAEQVNGFLVSDRYREKKSRDRKDLTYPPHLIQQLPDLRMSEEAFALERKKHGLPEKLHPDATSRVIEDLVQHYKGYWVQDRQIREASNLLLRQHKVDVFGVVFRIVDVSSHLFWTYLDPQLIREMRDKLSRDETLSQADIHRIDSAFSKVIEPVYIYVDQIIGDFLKHADANTSFLVCSDHGFNFEKGSYGHSKRDVPPDGILILSGSPFRKNFQLNEATLLDVTPTLLYLQGIPVGRDMDGKILFRAFDPDYVKSNPPKLVASHDKGYKQEGEPPSSDMDEEILEDLKALGYIQ